MPVGILGPDHFRVSSKPGSVFGIETLATEAGSMRENVERHRDLFERISEDWGLSDAERSALVRRGEPDEQQQMRTIVSASSYIRALYGETAGGSRRWIRHPIAVPPFLGRSPLDMFMDPDREQSLQVMRVLQAIAAGNPGY
jgi:hypothetical protein